MNPEETTFFVFAIDGCTMGLMLTEVDRVLPAAQLLEPPQIAPGRAGFLNYRGQAIAVLNFRELLGLPPRAMRGSDRIVLARACNAPIGLIVDEALGVYESERMQPFPAVFEALHIDPAIEGFVRLGEQLIVIQNLEQFLASSLSLVAASFQAAASSTGEPMP